MLRALLATAFGTVLAAAPAAAQPVTPPRTPGFCRQWLSDRMVAVACDPGKEARHIELRLGAVRSGASPKPGVGLLRGVEPLQPGETLRLRWRHPSSRAVLMVTAAAPRGPHTVLVDLRARPEHVEVTAQAGGGLVVTTPTGVTTVPAPPPPATPSWLPRTARAAGVQLLAAVDRMEQSAIARRTLCAALDREVFQGFELLLGDPAKYPCESAIAFSVFGDENVPRPTSTVHRGMSLAVGRGRALLSTTLTHRYRPSAQSDPTRLVVRARVLLVRDAQGIWRLATIEPLLPLFAVEHRRPYTDAELDRRYRADVRDSRALVAAAARLQARRVAATVDGTGPAPCAVGLTGDPTGDVIVQESDFRARDQRANAGVDVIGFGSDGRCVALRSAGPLPPSFELELRDEDRHELEVTVAAGHVLVEDVSDEDRGPQPLTGAAAHLDPDGLVLSLPQALTRPATVRLAVERGEIGYSDDATTGRGSTRRCARPTC